MSYPPERIVCLTEETVETLYLLGEEARIVGVSGYAVRPARVRREKPRVAAFISADVPKIIALEPDLVLTFSDLQADIVTSLIREGIAVHAFNQRTVADILDMIRLLGAMVGAPDIGLDADPAMIAAARQHAAKAGTSVAFVEGDIRSLPFTGSSFDVVVAITVLCFVRDAERAVMEMARVLRPGGTLVLGELGRFSLWAARRRLAGWLGSRTWRSATFRSPGALKRLAHIVHLDDAQVHGAIYYPPCAVCARWLAPLDKRISSVTTVGAAFLVLEARKQLIACSHRP